MKELTAQTTSGFDLYNGGDGDHVPLKAEGAASQIIEYKNEKDVFQEVYVRIKFTGLQGSGNLTVQIKTGVSSFAAKKILGLPIGDTTINNTNVYYQSPLIIMQPVGGDNLITVLAKSDNPLDTSLTNMYASVIDARANVVQWADKDATETNDLPDVNASSVGGNTPIPATDIDAIKDQTDQLEFDDSDPSGTNPIVATLTPTGLDNIDTTEPAGRASNFREMLIKIYTRFFNF
jgi:hypothetical protein